MRIFGAKKTTLFAVVAAAAAALISADAQAYSYGSWGSAGSYGGSYGAVSYGGGSYGGCYGAVSYGSGGSYGSYGRVGMMERMSARRQVRVADRQSRRAARSCYGSYGSAGSYGSYGAVSYGSYASVSYAAPAPSYGSAGSTIYSTPVEYSAPIEYSTPVETGCDCVSSVSTDKEMLATGSAAIEVALPADAKVFVNNALTTSTGSSRSYVSNGLKAGQTYAYKLRVEFEKNGETIVKNETIKLQAGNKVSLEFSPVNSELLLSAAQGPAKTELKLSVPENARVLLAGSPTKQTGAERTYITSQLVEGQEWEGYTVRVELERDGKQLVQERTLKVTGGQAYELAFDFKATEGATDTVQVAQLD